MHATALSILLAAGAPVQAETPKNALVIGTLLSNILSLDPAHVNGRVPSEVLSNLYDTLVQVSPDEPTKAKPMLAESWTVSQDHREIIFKIREGVTFSSGDLVTAADAAWSLQRLVKVGGVGSGELSSWGFKVENVDSLITAIDETTLSIKLPETVSTDLVLLSLASSSAAVLDSEAVNAHEVNGDFAQNWLKGNAAGSGAYKLTQWRPNDSLLADARQDYWQGAPKLRRVVMRHLPESGNLRLQLEGNDLDIGQYASGGDVEALQAKGFKIDPGVGFGFYYIALNALDSDLANPKVREAFQHAFDWKAVASTTMKFSGFPWQSIIPKGMPGAPEGEPTGYEYNPQLAKKLLAEAGYPNGLKKTLFPSGPALMSMAVALQASAREAGIELDVAPGEHTPQFRSRQFQVLVGNSGSRLPDPFGTALQYAYNPNNSAEAKTASYYQWRTGLQSQEINKLVDRSKSEVDPAKRAALFQQIDTDLQKLSPSLLVFLQRTDPNVVAKGVRGYVGHPTWSTRWYLVQKD